jgi:predicted aspartyl protease
MIALAVALATPGDGSPQSAAAVAFSAGDFAAARTDYERALAANPTDFENVIRLAVLDLYDEDLGGAQAFLDRAAAIEPKNPRVAAVRAGLNERMDVRASLGNVTLPAGDEADVPFVAGDPLPLVSVSVNGHDAFFTIDTGAPDIILDPDFARELGIASTPAGVGMFAGAKTAAVEHAVVASFGLGGATIRDMPATVLPTRNIPFFPGRRVDGMIGTGLLMRFTSTIDYPNARLVLRPRGATAGAPGGFAERMWLVGDHFIFARGKVNDLPESSLFVDTGLAGGGFMATKPTLDAAGITLDTAAAGTGTGGGGAVAIVPFTVDRLALGSAVVRDVRGLYTPEGSPLTELFPFTPGGLISHQFFVHYALTLDFVRMQIILTP